MTEILLEGENVQKAINMIRGYGDNREIVIKDIKELPIPSTALGALIETLNKIFIYVNYDFPEHIQECTVIHELLHVLLRHEGFPRVVLNENIFRNLNPKDKKSLEKIGATLSGAISHTQIFYREINEFSIDVDSYFEVQVDQKKNLFKKMIRSGTEKNYYANRQQLILFGIEYYSYPQKHRKIIQKFFRGHYPETYSYCNKLRRRLNFDNPNKALSSAKKLKKSVMKFGKNKTVFNRFLDACDIK